MKYRVRVELVMPEVFQVYVVEADSKDEAFEIAKAEYDELDSEVSTAILSKQYDVEGAEDMDWEDAEVEEHEP